MKNHNTIVLIGRFQPLHRAHVEIIRRATELGERVVILIGSSNLPRTYENPFTFAERVKMIETEISAMGADLSKVYITYLEDLDDDNAWAAQVQTKVENAESYFTCMGVKSIVAENDVSIIGHNKDESSFYLDMFPQWNSIEVEQLEPLNATDIRDLYFKQTLNMSFLSLVVPTSIFNFLSEFSKTESFDQILREKLFIAKYRKQYEHLPYAPTFVTADAVVLQSGHVLMIKRKSEPGRGLWALPGGFLMAEFDRSIEDAAIRELKEETAIKVPVPVLKGSIKGVKVFSKIGRSARGRTITHAHKIVLPDGELPKVKGMDDAIHAKWTPLASVNRSECFEDHYNIIQWAINS